MLCYLHFMLHIPKITFLDQYSLNLYYKYYFSNDYVCSSAICLYWYSQPYVVM